MEIEYSITASEQKRRILAEKNAEIQQTTTIPDSEATAEILNHSLCKINSEGIINIYLVTPIPTVETQKRIYAEDAGPASGNITKTQYELKQWYTGSYSSRAAHSIDYTIDSIDSLQRALAEIDIVRRERQAEADKKTAESAATFQARIDAYNAEHAPKPTETPPEPEPEPEEEKPDPFAAYRNLDGLELMLRHGREKQAKSMVLDFLEAEFAAKMSERGFEMLDTSDLEYSSLENYEGDIPVDALRELVKLADIDGKPYVYYESDDPYIGLDVTLRFDEKSRLVVVNIYQWDTDDDA